MWYETYFRGWGQELLTCNKVDSWLLEVWTPWLVSSTPAACDEVRGTSCRPDCTMTHPRVLTLSRSSGPQNVPTSHSPSLSLSVSPHNDDSWLFTGCSTPIWKCPICSLYKWSWVELFWQVGRSSLTGMTCSFDAFKSNCMCCRLWPYFSPHIWVNCLNWCVLDQNQNEFETIFLAFAQSLSSKTPHNSANELNSGPWHSLKSQLQTTKDHIFSVTPTGI